jgi:hypothetical protein
MNSMYRKAIGVGIGMALMMSMAAAHAGDIEIHGYGYQNYMQTDKNSYNGVDKKGAWDKNFLGLVGAVNLSDKSKLWAQLESNGYDTPFFTWFFLDYQFNDKLRGHVGRVKFPLGIYNETIDAKYLQVTALEPSMYQGATDMMYDAYNGLGLDYQQDAGNGEILWQVYAGNLFDPAPPVDSRDIRTIGGRVTYRTPVDGLRLLLSLNRTNVEALDTQGGTVEPGIPTGDVSNEDRAILSVDYVRDMFDVKAEFMKHKFPLEGVNSSAGYLQVGYKVTDKLMPYARYDNVTMDKNAKSDPSYYQKTVVVGVGYKFDSNIGFRLENHFNHGYALPVAEGDVAAGAGKKDWNMFIASINFIF